MEYLSLYIMSKTFFIFSPLFPLFLRSTEEKVHIWGGQLDSLELPGTALTRRMRSFVSLCIFAPVRMAHCVCLLRIFCYRNGIDSLLLLLCLSWAVRSCRSLFWIIPGTGLIQSGGPPCQVAPFSLHSFLTNTIKANLLGCIYLYPIGNYRHLAMPPPSPQPPTLPGPPLSSNEAHTHTQTIFFSGLVCLIAETTSSWLPHFLPFFLCVYTSFASVSPSRAGGQNSNTIYQKIAPQTPDRPGDPFSYEKCEAHKSYSVFFSLLLSYSFRYSSDLLLYREKERERQPPVR